MNIKKILLLPVIVTLFFGMMSCSSTNKYSNSISSEDGDEEEITLIDRKSLIVYFSRTGENYSVGNIDVGNTAIMAGYIADYIDADIYEIIPKISYPSGYEDCKVVATEEIANDARPEIGNLIDSIAYYDTIFLGYPIWYGNYPQIILSFLDSFDFTYKTIYPFVTHGGSGLSNTPAKLKSYLPNAKIGSGLAISGSAIRNDESRTKVNNWIDSLAL